MLEKMTQWLERDLIPALQLWPEEQYLRLGAALIACVLFGGQLARMTMNLPLRSQQGRIALSHLVFFACAVTLLRCIIGVSWEPVFDGLIAVAILGLPSYWFGSLSERAESSAKEIVHREVVRMGMRDRVLDEIRQNKVDSPLFDQAEIRADGDPKKARSYYIGARSRKLAKLEQEEPELDPASAAYGLDQFNRPSHSHLRSEPSSRVAV